MAVLEERHHPDIAIRLEGLEKTYSQAKSDRVVLRGLNATLKRGEFVAIRGRSGSGKTTLLNLLAGIDEPTGGTIYYDDIAFSSLSREERTIFRRDHIGFVFQFFNLIPTLTLLENVLLPAELAKWETSHAEARAYELLERVGLSGREKDSPDLLSGGEQQRVALARALMLKPMVILADEPTGNLDRSTGDEVMAMLDDLRKESQTLMIMVTHSHSLAERADRVLLLERGVFTTEEQSDS
jgi:putative ABC transport system ATP-binding protein